MKKTVLLLFILFISAELYSQVWEQTAGTPQGSGVTDMLVKQSNGFLFVTTGSFNFPSEPGGVRVSTDGGDTWQNQTSSYIARTIAEGSDGTLYASIWPDPNLFAAEGIYRTTNNGAAWNPLYYVQAGDNIFSIVVSPTTPVQTIFAGTRNGVIRSIDNGATFQNSGTGIASNSWVRDLAVDSSGVVAAATTNGLYISTDNGDSWTLVSGIPASDTTVVVKFYYPPAQDGPGGELYTGTSDSKLYKSFEESGYLSCTLLYLFDNGEPASMAFIALGGLKFIYMVLYFDSVILQSGVLFSMDQGQTFTQQNEGLPSNPRTSGFAFKNGVQNAELYTGLFWNAIGGAKIYKLTLTATDVKEQNSNPEGFSLSQNYPNPFNPSTIIKYNIPKEGYVSMKIYNTLGQQVAEPVNGFIKAGSHEFTFNASSLASGVYFYKIESDSRVLVKKMMVLK